MSSRFMFCLLIWGCAEASRAEDTLQSVMARMQPKQAVAIQYREQRTMSLLTEVWKGTGFFYATLPDLMLKEQVTPEAELMAIKGTQLYYFNQSKQQRHQGQLDDDNASAMNLAAFKGLMNGNLDYLLTLYNIDFSSKATGWSLTLTQKDTNASDADVKVTMSGKPEKVANKLILQLADGDRTDYWLTPAELGIAVETKIQKLFKLLRDEPAAP